MNEVCYSAKDAFEKRFNWVKFACESNNVAIYGSADWKQELIIYSNNAKIQQKVVHPNCENGLIQESEATEGKLNRVGICLMRTYFLASNNKNELLEKLNISNMDELLLFMVLANPTLLNDNDIQEAFFRRLSDIQQLDGSIEKTQKDEVLVYSKFFKFFEGAYEDDIVSHAYFPNKNEKEHSVT